MSDSRDPNNNRLLRRGQQSEGMKVDEEKSQHAQSETVISSLVETAPRTIRSDILPSIAVSNENTGVDQTLAKTSKRRSSRVRQSPVQVIKEAESFHLPAIGSPDGNDVADDNKLDDAATKAITSQGAKGDYPPGFEPKTRKNTPEELAGKTKSPGDEFPKPKAGPAEGVNARNAALNGGESQAARLPSILARHRHVYQDLDISRSGRPPTPRDSGKPAKNQNGEWWNVKSARTRAAEKLGTGATPLSTAQLAQGKKSACTSPVMQQDSSAQRPLLQPHPPKGEKGKRTRKLLRGEDATRPVVALPDINDLKPWSKQNERPKPVPMRQDTPMPRLPHIADMDSMVHQEPVKPKRRGSAAGKGARPTLLPDIYDLKPWAKATERSKPIPMRQDTPMPKLPYVGDMDPATRIAQETMKSLLQRKVVTTDPEARIIILPDIDDLKPWPKQDDAPKPVLKRQPTPMPRLPNIATKDSAMVSASFIDENTMNGISVSPTKSPEDAAHDGMDQVVSKLVKRAKSRKSKGKHRSKKSQ